MIELRPFTIQDAAVLREKQMPDASEAEVAKLIEDWKTGAFRGRFFEMLALTESGVPVGSVSLYGQTKSIASVGIEIFPDERGKGHAEAGMRSIIDRAKALGFRAIQDQVREDNAASRALHEKLGFETDGYVYTNARGRSVLIYLLCL